ncbi:MAG: tetratricopeptide repeat protein [Nostoc sp. ChiQUE02]|uniref:tetratricopeptide repeat protein n=1 Tax=Nostoc sp. ChiQUE02 TaxID=3075377 RepID=UPI002AD58828|nr:tetratricopeptide repeat protein [Nostoc sp. ChiQUE02]MDZ8229327.1 tetratricopeptide repeat protein [Nostoc sp. ChiQUE02]
MNPTKVSECKVKSRTQIAVQKHQSVQGNKAELLYKTEVVEIFQLAFQHQRANRLVEAELLYTQVLEKQPGHHEALYSLGMLAQQMGQPQTAEQWLNAALQIQPDSAKTWFSLGNLRLVQEQFLEAEKAYRQALVLVPDSLPIYNNLGYALQQQRLFEEAIKYYQKALKLKPDFIEAEANLGNALHAQGKLSSEQQLHYAQLNNKLGVARKKAGDLKTAVTYYKQAIALQPDFLEAHYNLGLALQEQSELEEAIPTAVNYASSKKLLKINPNYGEIYLNLGKIYQEQNNLTEAISAYRQGLKLINPHYTKVIESEQTSEIAQEVSVTPQISQGNVTVGAYQFPAIGLVPDSEKARPFWSVVVTVYNRTDYLLECLTSLLAQWPGEEEMEILLMDNASETPVLEMVNRIGKGVVRCYRNPENIGPVNNMNAGIALSRGKWIHILHDDDCVLPGFYARLKQSLEDCSDSIGAGFTGFEYINGKGEVLSSQEYGYGEQRGIPHDWLWKIGTICIVMLPAVVIRRETFERLGGYYPQLPEIADWEMNKRIASFYDWWYEPGILARYRLHFQRLSTEYWGSSKQPTAFRQAIEIAESYLPSEFCSEITAQARSQYFDGCLESALIPLKAGDIFGAFRIIQETLKLDRSPEAAVKLFAWLTQTEAAPLREEIIAKLLSVPVDNIPTELKPSPTAIAA